MSVEAYLAALLFFRGTAIKKTAVLKFLDVDENALALGILELRNRLEGGGLSLIETDTEVQLVTAPEVASFVEALQKEELKKDIGKAGAETLAIILYRGPVSRAEIDTIRGVNSSSMLRNLMVRGLIERSQDRSGGGYRFTASTELLAHLGVAHKEDLPEYSTVMDQLETFEQSLEEVSE